MSTRTRTARIRSVEPLGGFLLRLGFDDATVREIDLDAELWGQSSSRSAPIRSSSARYASTTSSGRSCGQNGADLDPDVLYGDSPRPPSR